MFVTIHQPEFMPWAGFFNKIARTEKLIVLDSVKFQKNYFDNRCRIKRAGAPAWLTVPVQHRDAGLPIKDMLISEPGNWEPKAWAAVEGSYAKAPFWRDHADFLKETFTPKRWTNLCDMNVAIIEYVCRYLEIPLKAERSSAMGVTSKGSRLVLDLCLKAGADRYLSGAFGRDYLDQKEFADAGVALEFQDFKPPEYAQFDGPYVGPLTIFDMLLNMGPGSKALIS